jgi:hypothetical protein
MNREDEAISATLRGVLWMSAAALRTRRIGVHLWRNLFHLGGQASWVYAIGALPLIAVVGAMFYAEAFDPAVILGALLIFGGTWYSPSRENRRAA